MDRYAVRREIGGLVVSFVAATGARYRSMLLLFVVSGGVDRGRRSTGCDDDVASLGCRWGVGGKMIARRTPQTTNVCRLSTSQKCSRF